MMQELPDYITGFTNFRIHEAIYQTKDKKETILLEFRLTVLEEDILFTVIDGKQIRVETIHHLVQALPALVSLSIPHSIRLLWNGVIKQGELVEIFSPSQDPKHPLIASLQLRLTLDDQTYETTICDNLQDAVQELEEMTEAEAQWWLCTCYHCHYSDHNRLYSLSDREYACYRDVPEALAEIRAKGKIASPEARRAGKYFVDAFHTCAAWKPAQTAPATEETS